MSRYNPDSPRAKRGKAFENLMFDRLISAIPCSLDQTPFCLWTRTEWLPSIHPGIEKIQLDTLESMWGDITFKFLDTQYWIECCSIKYDPTRFSKTKVRNFTEQYGHNRKWYAFKWEDEDEVIFISSLTFNAWIKKADQRDNKDNFFVFNRAQFDTIRAKTTGASRFISSLARLHA